VDPDSKRLRVSVTDGRGRRVRDGGLGRWLESIAPARAHGDVAVALAGDAQVRALNRRYRRTERPCEVLSFPVASALRRKPPETLGDIVIATGVARRQALAAGHSAQTELRVLALHGLLHLLGYDHDGEDDRMARVEARLRRKGGLRAGLIERADRVNPRRTLSR
jgi:probable rRNA maturation factor